MATHDGKLVVQPQPSQVKLPPPSGRPEGKGLESITRGGEEPAAKRMLVPDLTKGKK